MDVVFPTVLSGVLVLALGQVLVKFLIEPLHEYGRILGDIATAAVSYANVMP